jgi:pimeloyl-ACP methyl ester carboxylesterase
MTSKTVQFNYQNRGCSRDLVLIPGWATDVRIFEPLLGSDTSASQISNPLEFDTAPAEASPSVIPAKAGIHLPYNYILPTHIIPETFSKDLHHWLNENHRSNVSLLGWSMGGFLAADFARQFPSQVNELFLLSVRQTFDPKGLDTIRQLLQKDRRVYLYGFYTQCFRHCPADHLSRFKRSLFKPYIETMNPDDLLHGLDYLADATIDTAALSAIPDVHFFHGELDEITPIAEAQALASQIGNATFRTFPNLGHIIFYDPSFREGFNG